MFRIKTYKRGLSEPDIFEYDDYDEAEDTIKDCTRDLINGEITSFVASKISDNRMPIQKPFWEK